MAMHILTTNYRETIAYGYQLGKLLQSQDLILLDGDLGAGKTTLTQGIAQGLGIKRPIKSPTFTLIREYQSGRIPLYHMDMYRLEDSSADELGLSEYFNGDGAVVIEWSKFINDLLPARYLRVVLKQQHPTSRELSFQAIGSRYHQLLQQFKQEINGK